jgi:hypothetical protein
MEQYLFLPGQKGWYEASVEFKHKFWCGNKTEDLPPSSSFPRPPRKHFLDPNEGFSGIWRRVLFLDCSNCRRFVQCSHNWGVEILTFRTVSLSLSPSATVFNNNNNNKRQYRFEIPDLALYKSSSNSPTIRVQILSSCFLSHAAWFLKLLYAYHYGR